MPGQQTAFERVTDRAWICETCAHDAFRAIRSSSRYRRERALVFAPEHCIRITLVVLTVRHSSTTWIILIQPASRPSIIAGSSFHFGARSGSSEDSRTILTYRMPDRSRLSAQGFRRGAEIDDGSTLNRQHKCERLPVDVGRHPSGSAWRRRTSANLCTIAGTCQPPAWSKQLSAESDRRVRRADTSGR